MNSTHIPVFLLAVLVGAGFTAAVRGATLAGDVPAASGEVKPHAGHDMKPDSGKADPHAGHDMSSQGDKTDSTEADPHAGHDMKPDSGKADPHAGHDMSDMKDQANSKPTKPKDPAKPEISIRPEKKGDVIDLHNSRCPIMGGESSDDVFTDFDGLRVHFCCPGCESDFLANKSAGLAKMGITDIEAFKREFGAGK